eukprot:CAMPEP_0198680064 /NCGR_PEP_ID=MMETSP1468-20131203/3985_1 /TAXON_ID=1461545 /ORGANISM="Mantoniella sp, Strain CCMP1436" /LENGTH=39 /DNA_ID= /DNA_START= /DNA_END= /DNA_ORIENTATION=
MPLQAASCTSLLFGCMRIALTTASMAPALAAMVLLSSLL